MSRPFAKNNGKTTFGQIREPLNSGEHILLKKNKNAFCKPNYCSTNNNLYSQSNYIALKTANNVKFNPFNCADHTELYMNLITKMDLNNVTVVTDSSGNVNPVIIDTNAKSFLTYNIDPSGSLFGNTVCGINNFQNYMVYNVSTEIDNPCNISNL